MSFIYDEISSDTDKTKIGYFKTTLTAFTELEPKLNFDYSLGSIKKEIKSDTIVLYYCGAFTYFHKGHYSLINKAYNEFKTENNDVRVIISPANSSYIYQKYGPEYNVGNKIRFERIISYFKYCDCSFLEDIIIDMNPMLNMICDYNFTDLIKNYIEKYLSYESLKNTPYILCGKDKSSFKNLELYTDKLKIYYDKGCETSSSEILKDLPKFDKKNIILRVHNIEEFKIFKKFMESKYESITPVLIKDEIKYVLNIADKAIRSKKYNNIYTNCKNYKDILEYVRVTRAFSHPLDGNPKIESPTIKPGDLYIDSDCFSGTTKKHIESFGSTLISLHDFRLKQSTHDIVDIDDLYKSNFSYPHYDLSERMGLPLFNTEMHDRIQDLKDSLIFL